LSRCCLRSSLSCAVPVGAGSSPSSRGCRTGRIGCRWIRRTICCMSWGSRRRCTPCGRRSRRWRFRRPGIRCSSGICSGTRAWRPRRSTQRRRLLTLTSGSAACPIRPPGCYGLGDSPLSGESSCSFCRATSTRSHSRLYPVTRATSAWDRRPASNSSTMAAWYASRISSAWFAACAHACLSSSSLSMRRR
jgi:hypothetical protein